MTGAEGETPAEDVRADIVDEREPSKELVLRRREELDRAREPRAAPPYQSRFQLFFGFLIGIALAAAAATVLFATGHGGSRPVALQWSAWHPTSSDPLQALQQVADHVGASYKLDDGSQLVAVRASPLTYSGLPVTLAIRSQETGDIQLLQGRGVLFTLCGLGRFCSIAAGKPSVQRHFVLRRESLELALYTFRYIGGVDEVVVMLPPKPGQQPSQLMLYRRDELKPDLERPLGATLPGRPPRIRSLTPNQQAFIERLTGRDFYHFGVIQGQDASAIMVLDKIPTVP